ncbi:class I SAM-dependent methyltransferase [Sutcliffiella halmapala]
MTSYNKIGTTYDVTRKPDFRITQKLIIELDKKAPATILDVGAGTGNYSYELAKNGYDVIAVEPSDVMIRQGKQHSNLTWRKGKAEQLPIDDHSIDGIVCTLATHHFNDLSKSFNEMNRVLKHDGRIVIFTLDPRLCSKNTWLLDYFSELMEDAFNIHPPIESFKSLLEKQIKRPVNTKPFPLPHDLTDLFFFGGWARPELYLNKNFQSGTSPLSKNPPDMVNRCLERLKTDLDNGNWDEKYGELLNKTEYECGHLFVTV